MVALKEKSEEALREAHLEADAVEERLQTILDLLRRQSEKLEDLIKLLIEDRHGIASGPVVDLFRKRLQELREAQLALESLEDEATFLRDHLESSRPFLTIKSWNQK